MKDIIILVPVYNDVDCLKVLCSHNVFQTIKHRISGFVIVNDGSDSFAFDSGAYGFPAEVVNLQANLGHQKALAIGLAHIYRNRPSEKVIIMDADGEDAPEDILSLLNASDLNPGSIILAKRAGRKEGLVFQAGYRMYRTLFRLLTGYSISSGNFMLIPYRHLANIVFKNDIWNHLAAAIIKSKLPLISLPLSRQSRFLGKSKMSLTKLVIHGLGAITVFIDYLSARLLMGSLILLVLTAVSIATIICIKLFTSLAIPGWASVITGVMFIIFLQSFLLTLSTVVLYLSSQSQRQFIPGAHFAEFILKPSSESNEG